MRVRFVFTLRGKYHHGLSNEELNNLFLAGCHDAIIITSSEGIVELEFNRECGDTPDTTVEATMVQILKAGFIWSSLFQYATKEQQEAYDTKQDERTYGMHSAVSITDPTQRAKAIRDARTKKRLHKSKIRKGK